MDEELRANTSVKELIVVMNFADGDTRTVTIKNPRSDLTLAEIRTVFDNLVGPCVYSDKSGAAYTGFETPLVRTTTTVELTQ